MKSYYVILLQDGSWELVSGHTWADADAYGYRKYGNRYRGCNVATPGETKEGLDNVGEDEIVDVHYELKVMRQKLNQPSETSMYLCRHNVLKGLCETCKIHASNLEVLKNKCRHGTPQDVKCSLCALYGTDGKPTKRVCRHTVPYDGRCDACTAFSQPCDAHMRKQCLVCDRDRLDEGSDQFGDMKCKHNELLIHGCLKCDEEEWDAILAEEGLAVITVDIADDEALDERTAAQKANEELCAEIAELYGWGDAAVPVVVKSVSSGKVYKPEPYVPPEERELETPEGGMILLPDFFIADEYEATLKDA